MKKRILFPLALSAFFVCAFLAAAKPLGALHGVIEKDGEPFDNVLVVVNRNYFARLSWDRSKFYINNIPEGKITVTIYIADSLRGNYVIEFKHLVITANESVALPEIDFNALTPVRNNPIPRTHWGRSQTFEVRKFQMNESAVDSIEIHKTLGGFVGGENWRQDIDRHASAMIQSYRNNPRYDRYIVVEGRASSLEMNGDEEALIALSVARAKSVVEYIATAYGIGKEQFVVLGRGARLMLYDDKPYNLENMRALVSYDAR